MKTNLSVLGAVTLGAEVIEKHFTDDDKREGPDHKFAQNPDSLSIKGNEISERCLGDGIKRVEENEINTREVQRSRYIIRWKRKR